MDAELKQALADMESRISRHVDERLDNTLKQTLADMESRIYRHVDERLENTETTLLTAFRNWAQTYEVRSRGTSAAVREFDERLGFIEERVAKLERRPNGSSKT